MCTLKSLGSMEKVVVYVKQKERSATYLQLKQVVV